MPWLEARAAEVVSRGLAFGAIVLHREATGVKPILLLDDIFDKIDEKRVEALMKRVTNARLDRCLSQTPPAASRTCLPRPGQTSGCLKFKRVILKPTHKKRKRPVLRNSADYERAENSSRPLAEVSRFLRVSRMQGKLDEVEVREAWREVFGTPVENRTRKLHLRKTGPCFAC